MGHGVQRLSRRGLQALVTGSFRGGALTRPAGWSPLWAGGILAVHVGVAPGLPEGPRSVAAGSAWREMEDGAGEPYLL